MVKAMNESYAAAGVDVNAGNEAVARYRKLLDAQRDPRILEGIGGFGGCFEFLGYRKPVLVASTDGVGTKLKVAFAAGVHDTVGRDLVNHCVNDIFVQGARPLFFLDYVATGRLVPEIVASVVEGIATNGGDDRVHRILVAAGAS